MNDINKDPGFVETPKGVKDLGYGYDLVSPACVIDRDSVEDAHNILRLATNALGGMIDNDLRHVREETLAYARALATKAAALLETS